MTDSPMNNSTKKCVNCRAALVDKAGKPIAGVQCTKCKANQEKYGKPGVCKYCKLQAAFVEEKCVHCCHGERKFGPPIECNKCKLKSAFVRNGMRNDKPILCRLCDMQANANRQREKNKDSKPSSSGAHRSSGSSKQPHPPSSSSKHGQSTSKSHHHSSSSSSKRPSLGGSSGQPPSKMPKAAVTHSGTDEQILLVQQLRSDIHDLEVKLERKDLDIKQRDGKIAELNTDLLLKEKEGRKKVNEMQKRLDDQSESANEKIRSLQKQLQQTQKELKEKQKDSKTTTVTTVVMAATAPPAPASKAPVDSPIALSATS
ncbi:hypothetical protein L596_026127 [Steinernema carpocapsae]|uniref:Protein FAM76A n=2 Tax=Steinernema carpocapsae TaxID=34508 RepID=A0A4U5M0F4_STECR|nr:hypothetical protein L596_026127 [Steinernema carpocapsae]